VIHRIYSSLSSFKEIRLRRGLNILLAEKSPQATAKQTRNGAGKSSVLEIIHFICAGDAPEDSIFRNSVLNEHLFGMEFDLGGQTISAERSGARHKEIVVRAEDTSKWLVQPDISEETGEPVLSMKAWERVLGQLMFGLDGNAKGIYGPTFRSLFSYFARRAPGGFSEPHVYFPQSKPVSWQVAVSYLLGLDWKIPQQWQQVRDEEDEIRKLRSAVGEGDLAEIVGRKAELRSEIASQELALTRFEGRLANFQVLPDFRDYEDLANRLTSQIADLSNKNTIDRALIDDLEAALAQEKTPEIGDLDRMYREAGVILPPDSIRRFDEVRQFHESVIANRRSYLSGEIEGARRRIADRSQALENADAQRRRAMTLLKTHGALDQYSKLQAEFGKRSAELELLRKRFGAAEKIEGGLAKLKIRRQELFLRLQQDYSEQRALLNDAIVTFEEISKRLYDTPARFTPTESNNGPLFKVEVQGERSPGIGHMQIYCFDMMLAVVTKARGIGPEFLIHDSHLFDPVDGRQVGIALQLGAEISNDTGVQYLTTFNSDKQMEFDGDFDLSSYLVPVDITDANETGGLFGVRFD
jgi:uncharacterized protein YydD (DUF2326 family)